MAFDQDRFRYLLQAWTSRTATVQEEKELFDWVRDTSIGSEQEEQLVDHISKMVKDYSSKEPIPSVDWELLYERILAGRVQELVHTETPVRKMGWLRWIAAAAVIIVIAGAGWWIVQNDQKSGVDPIAKVLTKNDVLPGITKATLTLADGSTIILDTAKNGLLAQQGKTVIHEENGMIRYEGGIESDGPVQMNTLTTHKGEQYPITLSDGTKILADASTTIRFPASFRGNERTIEIGSGRVWLEVAKDAKRPFIVKKGDQQIEVLGTHFNVSAYDNEQDMHVTLVEGSVRVKNGNATGILKPGEQASLSNSSNTVKLIVDADVEQEIAWKDGKMSFHNADVESILREIERWYDVEVVMPAALPKKELYFAISRTSRLSAIVKVLENNGLKCEIDGEKRTLVVKP